MLPLAIGVAIFDELTRLTCLETDDNAPILAAIGTAYVDLIPWLPTST
jgi:hypothetical protein